MTEPDCHRAAAAPFLRGPRASKLLDVVASRLESAQAEIGCSDGNMDGQARGLGRAGGFPMEGCGRRRLQSVFAIDVFPGRPDPYESRQLAGSEPTSVCGMSGRALKARPDRHARSAACCCSSRAPGKTRQGVVAAGHSRPDTFAICQSEHDGKRHGISRTTRSGSHGRPSARGRARPHVAPRGARGTATEAGPRCRSAASRCRCGWLDRPTTCVRSSRSRPCAPATCRLHLALRAAGPSPRRWRTS